jgi:hypothetical protein
VPGSFRDSFVYNVTPTGSQSSDANWILVGATPSAPPQITSFAAVPQSIRPGQQTTLTWTTNNAAAVSIDNSVGPQPQSGSVTVAPSATTTYTLTATNSASSSTATVTVIVVNTPSLVISALPQPILQLANTGGTTTTFTISNTGGGSSNVTISPSATFFSVAPATFTLNAGSSQLVTVTAASLAAGVFEGIAQVSGTGFSPQLPVPVKVLST